MSVDLKICGLKRIDDIHMINEFAEIKYAGFVFAESKRKIDVSLAEKLIDKLRSNIKSVGVFADMNIDSVLSIQKQLNLDVVQLHSDETNDDCMKFNCTVWKSISVKNADSVKTAEKYTAADGFLLDTYNKNARGGTGKAFLWDCAEGFSKRYFTVLAGGIGENNILDACSQINPNVIDVSSSVETDGKKDFDKIKTLIWRIRK